MFLESICIFIKLHSINSTSKACIFYILNNCIFILSELSKCVNYNSHYNIYKDYYYYRVLDYIKKYSHNKPISV